MRVVLTDGSEFACRNFKAIDSGVLLTKDKKRKKVIGFVPHHQLRYVVEDDLEPSTPRTGETRAATGDAVTPDQRREATAVDQTLVIGEPTTAAEPAGGDAREVAGDDGVAGTSDLRRLGGLGSTYAERLHTAGYETLADLAVADPVAVAEAASVAPGRGRRWVTAAGRAVAGEANKAAGDGENDAAASEDHVTERDEAEEQSAVDDADGVGEADEEQSGDDVDAEERRNDE